MKKAPLKAAPAKAKFMLVSNNEDFRVEVACLNRLQAPANSLRVAIVTGGADSTLTADYKDPKTLRLFVTETGKMIPRRISGNCARHQRPLAIAMIRRGHNEPGTELTSRVGSATVLDLMTVAD